MKILISFLFIAILSINSVFASKSLECKKEIYPNYGEQGSTYWENKYDQSLINLDDSKTYNKITSILEKFEIKFVGKTIEKKLKIYNKLFLKLKLLEKRKFLNPKTKKQKKIFYILKVLESKIKLKIISLKISDCKIKEENIVKNSDVSCKKEELPIDGKIKEVIFSENGTEKIVLFEKSRLGRCDDCEGGVESINTNYVYYYKNGDLLKTFDNDSGFIEAGFVNGNFYIEKYYGNLRGLEFLDEKYYGYSDIKKVNNNFILRINNKEKVLFSDGTFSKEYDVIFDVKVLENRKKILLIGKGKYTPLLSMGESENFIGEYYIIKNGIEIELKNAFTPEYGIGVKKIVSCDGKYGYIYLGEGESEFLFFDGKKYGKKGFKNFNFYGFKSETCEPLFVIISNLAEKSEKTELFLGKKLISSNNGSIGNPIIIQDDIYFTAFRGTLGAGGGYKLYKNDEQIEGRGWVTKFGFLEGNKLVYATRVDGGTYIVEGDNEVFLEGVKWTDGLKFSKNKKSYAFNLRGIKNRVYTNGKIIYNPYQFVDGIFVKNDFISVYSNKNKGGSGVYFYLNNKLLYNISGNENIIIPNNNIGVDEIDVSAKIDFKNSLIKCK